MIWPRAALGDVCQVVGGGTPKTGRAGFWGGDVLWATPKDLSNQRARRIDSTARSITEAGLKSCGAQVLPAGSILLSSRAPIGLVAINTVPMATNQGFKSLVPDASRVDANYLAFWLGADTAHLQSLGAGATFKEVSKSTVSRIEFPLPPLDEQRRIARVLDLAAALRVKRCDSLVALAEVVRSVYLTRFGDPASNSRRLPLVPLSDLGRWRSGGTPPRSKPKYFDGDVPWFSSGELGPRFVSLSRESLSVRAFAETSVKPVAAGSLMIGMYDTAALKTSIATVDASCNQAVAFAKLDESIAATAFVHTTLVIGRDYFRRQQRGVRQKNLNLELLRSIRIPLPDQTSQREYLAALTANAACEERLRRHLAQLDALFASLQHRAFTGTV